jgi:hypothetical protein
MVKKSLLKKPKMKKFKEYIKEYMDVFGGSSGKMGGASKKMRGKYEKILLAQVKGKHPYAKKEIENLMQWLKF